MTYPLRLRFFTVEHGQLKKTSQSRIIDLWEEKRPWSCSDVSDFRLVTVLCDCDLKPIVWHVTRLAIVGGHITHASRMVACRAAFVARPSLRATEPRSFTPEIDYVLDGWPDDLASQLAVAMDSPLQQLQAVGVAGPLFTPGGVSVRQGLTLIDASLLKKS